MALGRDAFLDGMINFKGYSNTRLKALKEADKSGRYIYEAGLYWTNFDFDKGLDALIEIDKKGFFILLAGLHWVEFNHTKALETLFEIDDNDGNLLFKAKETWPLTSEQKDTIDDRINKGYWAYIEFYNGKITKEEALAKGLNSKWAKKISKDNVKIILKEKKEKKEKK